MKRYNIVGKQKHESDFNCISENREGSLVRYEDMELLLAKIWDNKYEEDKMFLFINNATRKTPRDLIEKYKKELGY